MKAFAIVAILVALYLLYRLAYPKQSKPKPKVEIPPKKKTDENSVVGQSRVVLSSRSQPPTTPAMPLKSGISDENTDNFATENEPMDIHVPLEYEPAEPENEADENEEAEELRHTLGSEATLASGFTFEEMDMAVGEVNHPSGENEAQAAEVLYRLENTECVTQLAAISPEKAARIKGLISLHVQSIEPTAESDEEVGNLDIADFLS